MVVKLASIHVQGCSLEHSRGKKIPPNRMKVCYWKMVDCVITCMVWNAMQKMKNRFHLYPLSWKDFHGLLLSGEVRCRDCVTKTKTKTGCVYM